ncbi:MAG: SIMPL domain-containing protein [Ignavibacteriaceae bacterium]|nr:SIMPL domain-containing protein [Ignavibacteriaceae bacterium]
MKITILFFILSLFTTINSQTITNSFIIIDADSRIEIPAKEITFAIVIEQVDTNAQNAYNGLKQLEEKFIPLLKEFNIPDSNISYSLSKFRREGGFNNRPVQFKANENIVIKLYDFKQYEPFQLALLSIGIYSFNGTFSTTEIKEAREIGFRIALEKAEQEAKLISNQLGRELGKVLEVESKNKDYVVTSPMQGMYSTVEEMKLIDIPQHVTLYTNVKVKYELK